MIRSVRPVRLGTGLREAEWDCESLYWCGLFVRELKILIVYHNFDMQIAYTCCIASFLKLGRVCFYEMKMFQEICCLLMSFFPPSTHSRLHSECLKEGGKSGARFICHGPGCGHQMRPVRGTCSTTKNSSKFTKSNLTCSNNFP